MLAELPWGTSAFYVYGGGEIDARQYAKREARLTGELAGAKAARDQAQRNAQSAASGPSGGDSEQELLDHLAALKAAVADGVEHAPNLNVLRDVLAEMFEQVELNRAGSFGQGVAEGMIAWHHDDPVVNGGYWLCLVLRSEAMDFETFRPMGRELPVPAVLVAKP